MQHHMRAAMHIPARTTTSALRAAVTAVLLCGGLLTADALGQATPPAAPSAPAGPKPSGIPLPNRGRPRQVAPRERAPQPATVPGRPDLAPVHRERPAPDTAPGRNPAGDPINPEKPTPGTMPGRNEPAPTVAPRPVCRERTSWR